MGEAVPVARVSEVPAGGAKVVEVAGRLVALFNVDGEFHAIDNTCLHKGGPLGEGTLHGFVIECPLHGWTYDVRTGFNMATPMLRVKRYDVKVEGDTILIAP